MELRDYKRTEVGFIPEDWQVKKLSEIGKFSKGSGVRKNEALSGNIPCVRYGELYTRHSDYIKQFYSFISQDISSTAKKLKKGDILFAGSGETKEEIGKSVAFINDFEAFAGGDIVILSPENTNSLYLGYLLNAPFVQKQKASRGQGDAVVHISSTQLGNISIPLPKEDKEQTAIATALSDADALINSLEKLIAKKRNIKQGAMQHLLKPKEGWEVKKLGESCEIFRGGSPRPIESYLTIRPDGINWIKIGDVKKNAKYIESTEEKIIAEGLSRSRFVNAGDFLLSNSMSFGRPYIMKTSGCIHDGWLVIQNYQNHFDREFLYYVLGSESILAQYKAMASGSSVLNLNKEIVKNVLINCPTSIQEQTRIATILSDMDNEIQALETKLEKYRKIKLGMMQNLLTGKIRLV